MKMKNGILRGDEGFDILINDMSRTFRDLEKVAYETARFMKQRRPEDLVEVRVRATGERRVILADGRTG